MFLPHCIAWFVLTALLGLCAQDVASCVSELVNDDGNNASCTLAEAEFVKTHGLCSALARAALFPDQDSDLWSLQDG